jgi:hypothetical protein
VAVGRVEAIRVQDVERGIWFNWDYISLWDQLPSCDGGNPVYVAFWVVNTDLPNPGTLTLQLVNVDTGQVLASKSEYVPDANGVGIEWNGTMPPKAFNLRCKVTP